MCSTFNQARQGWSTLFLCLPCPHSGRRRDWFISSHYRLCFFTQYGMYFLLEICSSFSLLYSKIGSIQLPRKHFFRDQRPTACHLCLYPGCPWYHPVPIFSRISVVILHLHSHRSLLWSDGLQQHWECYEIMWLWDAQWWTSGIHTDVGPHARSSRISNVATYRATALGFPLQHRCYDKFWCLPTFLQNHGTSRWLRNLAWKL